METACIKLSSVNRREIIIVNRLSKDKMTVKTCKIITFVLILISFCFVSFLMRQIENPRQIAEMRPSINIDTKQISQSIEVMQPVTSSKQVVTPNATAAIVLSMVQTQNYTVFYLTMLSGGGMSSSTNGIMRTMLQYSNEKFQWAMFKSPQFIAQLIEVNPSHKLFDGFLRYSE